jgi:hypothetical protein
MPNMTRAAACSRMALWQDIKTTPRRISAKYRIILTRKGPRLVFIVGGIGCRKLVLVPHGLIVERKLRGAARYRDSAPATMLKTLHRIGSKGHFDRAKTGFATAAKNAGQCR